jgi:hypothetical protein
VVTRIRLVQLVATEFWWPIVWWGKHPYALAALAAALGISTLAGSMSGCGFVASVIAEGAKQQAAQGQAASFEAFYRYVGDQSVPTKTPFIDALSLFAYPLNSSDRQDKKPLVICVVPEAIDGKPVTWQLRDASLDPNRILLALPDGTSVKPSGYALQARCPYPELRLDAAKPLAFQDIDFAQPLVWRRNQIGDVKELALKFDVPAPSPDKGFSLELGSMTLNFEKPQTVPTIGFARHRGGILRASSGGSAARARELREVLCPSSPEAYKWATGQAC